MADTWWKFDEAQDYRGVAGFVNGFRVRRLHASRQEANVSIDLGHFVRADGTTAGPADDLIVTGQEDVRLSVPTLRAMYLAEPQAGVPIFLQAFGMSYQAVLAEKGQAWAGTLYIAPETDADTAPFYIAPETAPETEAEQPA